MLAPPRDPKLYTQEELAEMLQVTVAAVRKWRQRGQINFIKIGNVVRFEHSEVMAFLEAHRSPKSA